MADLITLGVNPNEIRVLNIVRKNFKCKPPYNAQGEAFAIYVKRTLETA